MAEDDVNIEVWRDTDTDIPITMKSVGNIGGFKLRFAMKADLDGEDKITKLDTNNGGDDAQIEVTVGGDASTKGQILVKILDTDTDGLAVNSGRRYTDYLWGLKRDDAGLETVLVEGLLRLRAAAV